MTRSRRLRFRAVEITLALLGLFAFVVVPALVEYPGSILGTVAGLAYVAGILLSMVEHGEMSRNIDHLHDSLERAAHKLHQLGVSE
jgi:hypothetical protein